MDPYRELGVLPGATPDELRRAYRDRIRRLHPDSRARVDDPEADEELRRVTAAWHALQAGPSLPEGDPSSGEGGGDDERPSVGRHPRVRSRLGIVLTLLVLFLLFVVSAYAGSPADEAPADTRPRPRYEVND